MGGIAVGIDFRDPSALAAAGREVRGLRRCEARAAVAAQERPAAVAGGYAALAADGVGRGAVNSLANSRDLCTAARASPWVGDTFSSTRLHRRSQANDRGRPPPRRLPTSTVVVRSVGGLGWRSVATRATMLLPRYISFTCIVGSPVRVGGGGLLTGSGEVEGRVAAERLAGRVVVGEAGASFCR